MNVVVPPVDSTRRTPHMLAALAHTCAMSGDRYEAVKILEELKVRSAAEYVSACTFAVIHAALGETDRAIENLERTYEERSNWLVLLRGEPRLDNLRCDGRFADIVRRVGLAQ